MTRLGFLALRLPRANVAVAPIARPAYNTAGPAARRLRSDADMIITIDGPAGSGKSSVARGAAERLGFDFLDTGAMYRAMALAAITHGTPLDDPAALGRLAAQVRIEFDFSQRPPVVLLDGTAPGDRLRSADVTAAASRVAVVPAVREVLVAAQRRIAGTRPNLVAEGRDQGSVVFPDAVLKFYIDATPHERARRRAEQLREAGHAADVEQILQQIIARDQRDSGRAAGPLSVPQGAQVLDTTQLSEQQVIDHIVARARALEAGSGQAGSKGAQGPRP